MNRGLAGEVAYGSEITVLQVYNRALPTISGLSAFGVIFLTKKFI